MLVESAVNALLLCVVWYLCLLFMRDIHGDKMFLNPFERLKRIKKMRRSKHGKVSLFPETADATTYTCEECHGPQAEAWYDWYYSSQGKNPPSYTQTGGTTTEQDYWQDEDDANYYSRNRR